MQCHVAGWTGNSDDRVTGPSGQPRIRDREHVEPKAFNVLHNASAFVAKRPDIRKAKGGGDWGCRLRRPRRVGSGESGNSRHTLRAEKVVAITSGEGTQFWHR